LRSLPQVITGLYWLITVLLILKLLIFFKKTLKIQMGKWWNSNVVAQMDSQSNQKQKGWGRDVKKSNTTTFASRERVIWELKIHTNQIKKPSKNPNLAFEILIRLLLKKLNFNSPERGRRARTLMRCRWRDALQGDW